MIQEEKWCSSYSRPHVHNLCPDHRIHRILVPKPVLPATVDHAAVGTFDHIPTRKANRCCYPARCLADQHTNHPQPHRHHLNSPRPRIFCKTHPGGVRGSGRLGHYADLLASLIAGLKHGKLCQLLLCTLDPLAPSYPWPAPSPQTIPGFADPEFSASEEGSFL